MNYEHEPQCQFSVPNPCELIHFSFAPFAFCFGRTDSKKELKQDEHVHEAESIIQPPHSLFEKVGRQ